MKITFLLAAAALAPAALALPLPRGPSVRFPGPAILAATTPGVPPPAPAVHRPFALARDLPQRLYPDSHPDYEVAKEAWAGTPRVPCRFTWRQRHSDALAVWLVLAFFAVIVAVETVGAVCAR